jgi:hypothetical protein
MIHPRWQLLARRFTTALALLYCIYSSLSSIYAQQVRQLTVGPIGMTRAEITWQCDDLKPKTVFYLEIQQANSPKELKPPRIDTVRGQKFHHIHGLQPATHYQVFLYNAHKHPLQHKNLRLNNAVQLSFRTRSLDEAQTWVKVKGDSAIFVWDHGPELYAGNVIITRLTFNPTTQQYAFQPHFTLSLPRGQSFKAWGRIRDTATYCADVSLQFGPTKDQRMTYPKLYFRRESTQPVYKPPVAERQSGQRLLLPAEDTDSFMIGMFENRSFIRHQDDFQPNDSSNERALSQKLAQYYDAQAQNQPQRYEVGLTNAQYSAMRNQVGYESPTVTHQLLPGKPCQNGCPTSLLSVFAEDGITGIQDQSLGTDRASMAYVLSQLRLAKALGIKHLLVANLLIKPQHNTSWTASNLLQSPGYHRFYPTAPVQGTNCYNNDFDAHSDIGHYTGPPHGFGHEPYGKQAGYLPNYGWFSFQNPPYTLSMYKARFDYDHFLDTLQRVGGDLHRALWGLKLTEEASHYHCIHAFEQPYVEWLTWFNQRRHALEVPPATVKQAIDHFAHRLDSLNLRQTKLIVMEAAHGCTIHDSTRDFWQTPTHIEAQRDFFHPQDYVRLLKGRQQVFFEGSYCNCSPTDALAKMMKFSYRKATSMNEYHYLGTLKSIDYAHQFAGSVHDVINIEHTNPDLPFEKDYHPTSPYDLQRRYFHTDLQYPNGNWLWFQAYSSIIHGVNGIWFWAYTFSFGALPDAVEPGPNVKALTDSERRNKQLHQPVANKGPISGSDIVDDRYQRQYCSAAYQFYIGPLCRELRYLREKGFLQPSALRYRKTDHSDTTGLVPPVRDYLFSGLAKTAQQHSGKDYASFRQLYQRKNGQHIQAAILQSNPGDDLEGYGLRYSIRCQGNNCILIITNPSPFHLLQVPLNFSRLGQLPGAVSAIQPIFDYQGSAKDQKVQRHRAFQVDWQNQRVEYKPTYTAPTAINPASNGLFLLDFLPLDTRIFELKLID